MKNFIIVLLFLLPNFLLVLNTESVCWAIPMNNLDIADVDKNPLSGAGDNTCWVATASNMLAGAGYGKGNTIQNRAQNIYDTIVGNYLLGNKAPLGRPDWAISYYIDGPCSVTPRRIHGKPSS
jgi:hypothetical protein